MIVQERIYHNEFEQHLLNSNKFKIICAQIKCISIVAVVSLVV